MRQRTLSLRRRLFVLGLLIVCPLLVAGLIVSVLYVLKEHNNLRNEAIATVRDAATTIDHELRSQLLALQIISTSVDVGNGSFERVYQQAKQLSETMAGSVVSLRRENGDVIFNTLFPLGTAKIEGHTISETGVQLAELSLGANLPGSGTEFSLIAVNAVVDIAVLVRTFSDQFSINPLDPNSPNFSVTNPDEFIGLFFWTRH